MITAGCFSIAWLIHLIIWLVVVGAIVAILRIVIPWAMSIMGVATPITQIINIIIGAVVVIAVLLFVVNLLECLRFA